MERRSVWETAENVWLLRGLVRLHRLVSERRPIGKVWRKEGPPSGGLNFQAGT